MYCYNYHNFFRHKSIYTNKYININELYYVKRKR